MAWNTPTTATANTTFTAGHFNNYVRDNFLEVMPAKATTKGSIFVGTGANSIADRIPVIGTPINSDPQTTTQTAYDPLWSFGPSVTATTGSSALVFIQARVRNLTTNNSAFVSYSVEYNTSIPADDSRSISSIGEVGSGGNRCSVFLHSEGNLPLNPGSNRFTLRYRVGGGEGEYARRRIVVVPL